MRLFMYEHECYGCFTHIYISIKLIIFKITVLIIEWARQMNRKKKSYIPKVIRNFKREYQLHIIILIPFVWLILFAYVPMYGSQIAFKDFVPGLGIVGSPWAGTKHFVNFFKSYQFWTIVKNTLGINIYSILVGFPIPIFLALSINATRNVMFKKTVQLATYAPYFISTVVMVGILIEFLSPNVGVYGKIVRIIGAEPRSLLGEAVFFKSVYVWSGIWQTMGWSSIIYIAVLSSVDLSLYDAATVDGASRFQRIIHIDFPSILPTAVILLIVNSGRIMSVGFEKIYLMQNDLNISSSEVIQTFIYKVSFKNSIPNYSYATAIGLFNSVINFILIIIVNTISKRVADVSLW